MRLTRRQFLGTGLLAAAAPAFRPAAAMAPAVQGAQDSLAGRGATGTLRDPAVVGRPRLPTYPRENNAEIQALEQRLACSCGCTLDVFTCRTTDFTCTYSPKLHAEVLALHESGQSAKQILDTFVAKYGEKALMAPKAEGFNLAGYLLPGGLIVAAGAALAIFVGRRKEAVARVQSKPASGSPPVTASPAELERLERELADVQD
ncbi:MAG TPA: cytochrome c-type biogenesis protein CcmH [Gemmatimonadales bacterium]